MTLALATTRIPLPNLRRLWADAPAFTTLAVLLTFALIPLYAAMALDTRAFDGESPWLKPVKFHYALGIYAVSLAFFARYMPASTRESRLWRGYVATVVIAILGEVVWLSGAAMQNTASHFNTTVPLFTALYPLMGAFAVLLTSASLTMGISILRNKDTTLPPALHLSIALGLILTFAATVPVAGYLSSAGSHFVGPSSRQMWLLAWSRDAGDLRVAHFLATHALHFVPLGGLLATRLLSPRWAAAAVLLASTVYAALIAATFLQALQGRPFLPWLG